MKKYERRNLFLSEYLGIILFHFFERIDVLKKFIRCYIRFLLNNNGNEGLIEIIEGISSLSNLKKLSLLIKQNEMKNEGFDKILD